MLRSAGRNVDAAVRSAVALNVMLSTSALPAWAVRHVMLLLMRAHAVATWARRSSPAGRSPAARKPARGLIASGVLGNLAGWCELFAAMAGNCGRGFRPGHWRWHATGSLVFNNVVGDQRDVGEVQGKHVFYQDWARRDSDGGTRSARRRPAHLAQSSKPSPLKARAIPGCGVWEGAGRACANSAGLLNADDWKCVERRGDPLTAAYRRTRRGYSLLPCQGFQDLLMLRILYGFDIASLERMVSASGCEVFAWIRIAAGNVDRL